MSIDGGGGSAAALRRAFDRSFAEARGVDSTAQESFLALRVGGDPYAVRLAEIASVQAHRKIVPIPTRSPDLLGVTGLRGVTVPVYDLRALLGYAAGARPPWLLLVRAPDLVGLAFDHFERHFRVAKEDVSASAEGAREIVLAPGGMRPIIHVGSLVKLIGDRVDKER